MTRFAPLALIVFALAVVPAAFAATGTPAPSAPPTAAPTTTQPTTPPATQNAGRPGARMRIEILRLRLQIVQLRIRLHCGRKSNASHDTCVAFAQKVADRLTKLDDNVEQRIADLKNCTSDSTDSKCKNADKKIAVLTKLDTHLQSVIQKLQDWLNGTSSSGSTPPSPDAALDQAAAGLGQAAAGSGG